MSTMSRMVGVVCLRRRLQSRWASEQLEPYAVLSDAPETPVGAGLGDIPEGRLVYFGAAELAYWAGETGHYRDNLATGAPRLWVALTPQGEVGDYAVGLVTANPYEGESLSDGSGVLVDAVPMPAGIAAELAAFVETHHVEQVFVKRKRQGRKGERDDRG